MSTIGIKMTAIADEIRELSGATGALNLDAMATNVENANIEIDTQHSLLEQALALIEGKASGSGGITPEGTITITENGTHNVTNYALANVALPEVEQVTPSITVSTAGLITASATQESGVVKAGTKSSTQQLTTKSAQTYTPSTSNQTISSGRYLTGTQTIKGDANLIASNIKSGVSIFNVAGSYTGATLPTLTTPASASNILSGKEAIDSSGNIITGTMTNKGTTNGTISTKSGSYTIPTGYHSGSGKVTISTTEQNKIIASNIKSGVSILGVTGSYTGDGVTLPTLTNEATATQLLSGKQLINSSGDAVTGTMTNRGTVTGTISSKSGSYTIASGYHSGSGKVSISSTEQAKIVASNIKSGVSILGVTGSYTGNVGAFSKSQIFEWTPTTNITTNVTISHSLGVQPDGFMMFAECSNLVNNQVHVYRYSYDSKKFFNMDGMSVNLPYWAVFNAMNYGAQTTGGVYGASSHSTICTSNSIIPELTTNIQRYDPLSSYPIMFPAGQLYTIVVYKW